MEDPEKSSSLQNSFLTPDIYNDLSDYLRQRLVKKGDNKEITNTRIGDNTKGIYGNASKKDLGELKEEGIEAQMIPWIEDKDN